MFLRTVEIIHKKANKFIMSYEIDPPHLFSQYNSLCLMQEKGSNVYLLSLNKKMFKTKVFAQGYTLKGDVK